MLIYGFYIEIVQRIMYSNGHIGKAPLTVYNLQNDICFIATRHAK